MEDAAHRVLPQSDIRGTDHAEDGRVECQVARYFTRAEIHPKIDLPILMAATGKIGSGAPTIVCTATADLFPVGPVIGQSKYRFFAGIVQSLPPRRFLALPRDQLQ